jgi:uncharacterized protein
MAAQLPNPEPSINPETNWFWSATTRGELQLERCNSCGLVIWYPRSMCPRCSGTGTDRFVASGLGRIYTFAVVRTAFDDYREFVPYVLAYVELDEGPRMMTNIIDCDIDTLEIGQRVEVVFQRTESGRASLLRFRPMAVSAPTEVV